MDVKKAKQIVNEFFYGDNRNMDQIDLFEIHEDIHGDLHPKLVEAYIEYMVLKTLAQDTGTKEDGCVHMRAAGAGGQGFVETF